MILQAQNREQTVLYTSLEDLISPEHPVRIIDYLIETLQKKKPDAYKYKGESPTGCPAVSMTLRGGVERIMKKQIPEIKSVNLY